VNFRDGNETTAYYTDNLEDAINTAVEMARRRSSCETGSARRLNKFLARSNKSRAGNKATNKGEKARE